MATLVNQEVSYESTSVAVAFATMTPDSVRTVFTSATRPWSGNVVTPGVEPYVVAPYGLMTGGEVTPGAVAGNVAVAAATAMMPGVTGHNANTGVVNVNADTALTITLNTTEATPYRIDSVTVDNTGTYALVSGAMHASAFTESRGVAGGPPSIPLGSIEVAQIRRNFWHGSVNRAVTAAEIFAVPGTHQERYDFPVWSQDPIRGQITFAAALPLIHGATANVAPTAGKLVYARYATPLYAPIPRCRDWVPAETSNSTSSEAYYDNVNIGSFSSSIGQASFTASLSDGITDTLLSKVGANLLFRFKPDKNRAANQVTQGVLAVTRTFGVGAAASGDFTISPSQASVDFPS
jgi:hypothetical protein